MTMKPPDEHRHEPPSAPRVPEFPGRVTAANAGEVLEAMGQLAQQVLAVMADESLTWSRDQLHDQIVGAQHLLNSVGAAQMERVARFSRDAEGEAREFAPDDLAPALGWGPRQAVNKVEDALDAGGKAPQLLAAAGHGRLEPWRIRIVTEELLNASWRTCEKVERDLLAEGIESWTAGRTRRRARAAVRRYEPAAQRQAITKRAEKAIDVRCCPGHEPGTSEWHATIRVGDHHTARSRGPVDEDTARRLRGDDDADHVVPWPAGPTEVANLQLLCRHHHRTKHEAGWTVTMTPDGTCAWTGRSGRLFTTQPGMSEVISDLRVSPGAA